MKRKRRREGTLEQITISGEKGDSIDAALAAASEAGSFVTLQDVVDKATVTALAMARHDREATSKVRALLSLTPPQASRLLASVGVAGLGSGNKSMRAARAVALALDIARLRAWLARGVSEAALFDAACLGLALQNLRHAALEDEARLRGGTGEPTIEEYLQARAQAGSDRGSRKRLQDLLGFKSKTSLRKFEKRHGFDEDDPGRR